MSYKTIFVQVDKSANAAQRIQIAVRIALAENARVIGIANSGAGRLLREMQAIFSDQTDLTPYVSMMKARAVEALNDFERIAQSFGTVSVEKRIVSGETGTGISAQARYGDLVVHGQFEPTDPWSSTISELPEYVAMNSGSPVLVVPRAGSFNTMGETVLIGWNGSLAAARAVRGAIPLLARAKSVQVVLFRSFSQSKDEAIAMSANIGAYLTSHGIKADVLHKPCNETTEGEMGTLLLALAGELHADLLVIGCYGHSRFREIVLGGASRTVLESATMPVFMAH